MLQPPPFVNLSVDTLAKAKRLTHFYSVAPLRHKFPCAASAHVKGVSRSGRAVGRLIP
nr:MAG TPA: hypothetical protein [Caudoviricetes sp.]